MAILTAADIPVIRNLLGDIADDWADTTILAAYVVRPVEATILRAYPDIDQVHTDTKLAATLMVAAAHLRSQPEITQSRLGDSQVSIAAGDSRRVADQWEAMAWAMLSASGDDPPPTGILFHRVKGRR
jgi:hypothetical protein